MFHTPIENFKKEISILETDDTYSSAKLNALQIVLPKSK